jgi:DNA-binding response OmpR family regulator
LLVVDDDEGNRVTMSALLEDEGFEVDVAESLERARQALASSRPAYSAVLLDEHLGDGRGSELIPELRALNPTTKILRISGSEIDDASLVPGDGAIMKGAPFPMVLATLRSLLATG